jgi:predicted O-methyltransferase YrrM
MRFIQDVPRFLGTGDYANLGHARGASALLLADGLREYGYDGKVYSVDLFSRKNDLKKALALVDQFELKDRVELCKGSTKKWAEDLQDKRFKFIFVDADHTYEGVKNDFYAWSFLLEKGGWISFHDTNQDFSHKALQDTVVGRWHELKAFHVHRIRVFCKPS